MFADIILDWNRIYDNQRILNTKKYSDVIPFTYRAGNHYTVEVGVLRLWTCGKDIHLSIPSMPSIPTWMKNFIQVVDNEKINRILSAKEKIQAEAKIGNTILEIMNRDIPGCWVKSFNYPKLNITIDIMRDDSGYSIYFSAKHLDSMLGASHHFSSNDVEAMWAAVEKLIIEFDRCLMKGAMEVRKLHHPKPPKCRTAANKTEANIVGI